MSAGRRYPDVVIYRRLLSLARPYWGYISVVFILNLLSTPLMLLMPLPVKIAVDSVIGSHPLPGFLGGLLPEAWTRTSVRTLAFAACLLVALTLLKQLQGLAIWLLQTSMGQKLVLSFRARLFRHVQLLSFSYHDAKGTADSIYRIQSDASCVQDAVNGVIPSIVSGCTILGMIYVTAVFDWQLAVVALSILPVLFLLIQASRKRLRGRWAEIKEVETSAMAVVQEALGSLRVVKAFGREDGEQERFVRVSKAGMWKQIQLAMTQGSFNLLVGVTLAIGTAAVLVLGVFHVRSGLLTLGDLLLVLAYIGRLYEPLETIGKKVTQMQSVLASAERAFALLDEVPEIVERSDALPLVRAKGAVAFRNVSFDYRQDRPALRNISFEVEPGTRVGIAGRTGAGKSTLVSLLMRHYDPRGGQILLDGLDLRDYRLADLRNQFGIVLQEPVLFSTSIAENIAYARPDASEEDIMEAAKAANAHEFIMRLPEGYETQVGERGMRLSGGERQRITLARAFLKDAPLLILDEPTSSVDTKTEAVIMEAMERLMHGRTTFLIAHRLDTLSRCNMRLQLEKGRLVEARTAQLRPDGDMPNPRGLKFTVHAGETNT